MNKISKIMIADDDPGIVNAVEIMLVFEGYNVVSTMDGAVVLNMDTGYPRPAPVGHLDVGP